MRICADTGKPRGQKGLGGQHSVCDASRNEFRKGNCKGNQDNLQALPRQGPGFQDEFFLSRGLATEVGLPKEESLSRFEGGESFQILLSASMIGKKVHLSESKLRASPAWAYQPTNLVSPWRVQGQGPGRLAWHLGDNEHWSQVLMDLHPTNHLYESGVRFSDSALFGDPHA